MLTRLWSLVVWCSVFLFGSNLRADKLLLTIQSHPLLTLSNGIVGDNYSVQYSTNLIPPT